MPQVFEINDVGLLGLLAGGAGSYRTNNEQSAIAFQRQQAALANQRADTSQALGIVQMNNQNAYQQQTLQQRQAELEAAQSQRNFANDLASNAQDYNQNVRPQQEMAADQAKIQQQAQMAEQLRQQHLSQSLEAIQGLKGTMPDEQFQQVQSLVQAGNSPIDVMNKLGNLDLGEKKVGLAGQRVEQQGAYTTARIADMTADNVREDALAQKKLQEVVQFMTKAEAMQFNELRSIAQTLNPKRDRERRTALANQMQSLYDTAVRRMQEQAVKGPATAPVSSSPYSLQSPAAQVQQGQPGQIQQVAQVVAQKYGLDPQQVMQVMVQLKSTGKPSPQQVLQAAGGNLLLAADLADAMGL